MSVSDDIRQIIEAASRVKVAEAAPVETARATFRSKTASSVAWLRTQGGAETVTDRDVALLLKGGSK